MIPLRAVFLWSIVLTLAACVQLARNEYDAGLYWGKRYKSDGKYPAARDQLEAALRAADRLPEPERTDKLNQAFHELAAPDEAEQRRRYGMEPARTPTFPAPIVRKPDGSPCSDPSECESGFCPPGTNVCTGPALIAEGEKEHASNPYCDLDRIRQLQLCRSVDSESRLGWHGHSLGEPVDMQACLTGLYEPFDFRLVDPRTGATILLSLTAVDGFAIATTHTGECWDAIRLLLAPDAVQSVGNFYGNAVSVRVRGTYQGLYPLRQFTTGMEAEPTRLLIHATHVERQAQRR